LLIVDDEPDMREFLAFTLEEYGATVFVVSSAQEALRALTAVQPDLLISDVGMPEVDGYMLLRQVRSLAPDQGGNTPAIALTAYASQSDRQLALAAGFQQHVAKPVDAAELLEAIAALIDPGKSQS
jgi:CheY-like chemotaxis protein